MVLGLFKKTTTTKLFSTVCEAENGVFHGWINESKCMAECLASASCVAVDVGVLACILHRNASDLMTTYYVPGVTHYMLNRQCLTTTTTTTESPSTTTTTLPETASGTSMFTCAIQLC